MRLLTFLFLISVCTVQAMNINIAGVNGLGLDKPTNEEGECGVLQGELEPTYDAMGNPINDADIDRLGLKLMSDEVGYTIHNVTLVELALFDEFDNAISFSEYYDLMLNCNAYNETETVALKEYEDCFFDIGFDLSQGLSNSNLLTARTGTTIFSISYTIEGTTEIINEFINLSYNLGNFNPRPLGDSEAAFVHSSSIKNLTIWPNPVTGNQLNFSYSIFEENNNGLNNTFSSFPTTTAKLIDGNGNIVTTFFENSIQLGSSYTFNETIPNLVSDTFYHLIILIDNKAYSALVYSAPWGNTIEAAKWN